MKKIFITWYDGFLNQNAKSLISYLQGEGYAIETSPYSPHCGLGHDPKWDNWYSADLSRHISASDIYIACITDSWSGSSWMGQELSVAYWCYHKNNKPKMYHINFDNCGIDIGLVVFLKNSIELPTDNDGALKILSGDML